MVVRFSAALAALASSVLAFGCDDDDDIDVVVPGEVAASVTFRVTTLVTNATNADLINPWGIVSNQGLFWIADEGTGLVSVLDRTGNQSREIPRDRFSLGEGITGIANVLVAGDTTSFLIDTDLTCGTNLQTQAQYIVARMNGTLIALNSEAPTGGVVVVDQSSRGAAYFGVTRVDTANGPLLLAANFAQGRIDIFDADFRSVTPTAGTTPFNDPELPAGFAPWNVMAFGDLVFVAYAAVSDEPPAEGETAPEEETGPGLGHVTIFDTTGAVVARLDNTLLNAPWGMAVRAPDTSLDCDNDDLLCLRARQGAIYVGNFGDGRITTFDPATFQPIEQLVASDGNVLALEGLWGLTFSDDPAVDPGSLFFVAGPAEETAGVFGRLDPVVTTEPGVIVAVDEDTDTDVDEDVDESVDETL